MQNQFGIQRGGKDAGRDRIHADIVGSEFDRQRLGQSAHARLADPVCGDLVKGDKSGERGDIQDLAKALAHHRLAENLARAPGTVQIYIQNAGPLLFRTLEGRGLMGDPGGVHQNVDLAKAVQNLLLQQFDRRPVAHIHRRAQGTAPQTLNFGSDQVRFCLAAGDSHHVRSCLRNSQGDCLPQTRCTTYDNRALTAEIKPAGTQCLLQDANKVG